MIAFTVLTTMTVVVGVFAIHRMAAINETGHHLGFRAAPSVQFTSMMRTDMSGLRRSELAHILSTDEAGYSKYEKLMEQYNQELKQQQSAYEALVDSDQERKLLEDFKREWNGYLALSPKVVAASRAHDQAEATRLVQGDTRIQYGKAEKAIADLIDLKTQQTKQAAGNIQAVYASARLWTAAVLLLTVCAGLLFAMVTARQIANPLKTAVHEIQRAEAENSISLELTVATQDEIGDICRAFNSFLRKVHGAIAHVGRAAAQLAGASEQISAGANQGAEGSSAQSDQATQVATAVHEMSATASQVAANSKKAADASHKAADTAKQGGKVMDEVLATMRSIAASVEGTAGKIQELGKNSEQVGKIVAVIDEIADQTNLLALNAAIEAARAGEQGRGFAVVADEVRKLAERTTKATKEIASMIETVQTETRNAVQTMESGTKQVEHGVETTTQASASLRDIIQAAQEVGDMIALIAQAAGQQSNTTGQITSSMEQIARITQESAVGARESAKSCEELSGLALELNQVVGQFKMADAHVREAAAAEAPGG
jgi:methyl-accepting chemotaxis protein